MIQLVKLANLAKGLRLDIKIKKRLILMILAPVESTVGNTVFDSQMPTQPLQYGVDWLNVLVLLPTEQELVSVLDFVADSIGDVWQPQTTSRFIGRDWSSWAKSTSGALAGWNRLDDGYELLISLNGESLAGTGGLRPTMRLMNYLRHRGAKATRIDINADDRSGAFVRLRPLIKQAWLDFNNVGFLNMDERKNYRREGIGKTLYLGSRASTSYTRIYDKGEIVRWEREMKDGRANAMYILLCQAFELVDENNDFDITTARVMRDSLFSSVDFIERKDKNLSRGTRLSWWQEFLDSLQVQPLKLSAPKRVKTMYKVKLWIEDKIAKSLAKMQATQADYPAWIRRLVIMGKERFNKTDLKQIDMFFHEEREAERLREIRREENGDRIKESDERFFERMNKQGFRSCLA